jgi:hypothetical protein
VPADDNRVLDLWAAGVTLYLWTCGRLPFEAPTVMLLMQAIAEAPEQVSPPSEASAGLANVIRGLLTRTPATRLTLAQLRHDPWLTKEGSQHLPVQPVVKVEVSAEEIAQAVSNRAAIAVGSAAGPSSFGAALQLVGVGAGSTSGSSGGWKREGVATIIKRTDEGEADFWRSISASGHLAPHLPLLYTIQGVDEVGDGEVDVTKEGRRVFDITMQDLVAPMTRPCALALLMGNHTVTKEMLALDAANTPRADLLEALQAIAPTALSDEERSARGVTARRFLSVLDSTSTTDTLGFRIDAAKTIVNGELNALPLPEGKTFDTLHAEDDVVDAFAAFFQRDASLASTFSGKVQALLAALGRSTFFQRHVLLRTTLLFVYDDASRSEFAELKMMNFGASYALPEGGESVVRHDVAWDGSKESDEDGYLQGVRELDRVLRQVCDKCAPPIA